LNPLINVTIVLLRLFGSGELNILLTQRITGLPLLLYYALLILVSYSLYSKGTRRLILLYLLLVGNCFAAHAILSGRPAPSVTVFSVPGGLVSVNRLSRPQVVLSDLPRREYILAERIIDPYLTSRGIDPDHVIALSDDYRTAKESAYFISRAKSSCLYLPLSSRNAFRDICEADSIVGGAERVVYYGKSRVPEAPDEIDMWLTEGLMLCRADSSAIVFVSTRAGPARMAEAAAVFPSDLILVKAVIYRRDVEFLCGEARGSFQLVVCNRLSKPARAFLAAEKASVGESPSFLETSQVGAVELVAKNARLSLAD
jgi:hypothetical protein